MERKNYLVGHRIEDISFQKGMVACDCGHTVKAEGYDVLAQAFAAHRREEATKAGFRLVRA